MYYKRIEKKDYFYINAPIALEKSYETLKNKKGVIVSSDDNGEFLLVPTEMIDEYIITSVSKQDIISKHYDPSQLTDSDMNNIASEMSEDYTEYGNYWDSLESQINEYNLPKLHLMLETSIGEVRLTPEVDDDGDDCCDIYNGDNWDNFVGRIYCDLCEDKSILLEEVEELLNDPNA